MLNMTLRYSRCDFRHSNDVSLLVQGRPLSGKVLYIIQLDLLQPISNMPIGSVLSLSLLIGEPQDSIVYVSVSSTKKDKYRLP